MTKQLTTKEIRYGSSLIATFMGYRYHAVRGTTLTYLQQPNGSIKKDDGSREVLWKDMSIRGLEQFHENIHWIRLVVLEAYSRVPKRKLFGVPREQAQAYFLFKLPITTPVSVIFMYTVRFIEWYNKQMEEIKNEVSE